MQTPHCATHRLLQPHFTHTRAHFYVLVPSSLDYPAGPATPRSTTLKQPKTQPPSTFSYPVIPILLCRVSYTQLPPRMTLITLSPPIPPYAISPASESPSTHIDQTHRKGKEKHNPADKRPEYKARIPVKNESNTAPRIPVKNGLS